MENVVNAIATDAKPAEISAAIKDAIFAKTAERIEALRPQVAASLFANEVEDDQSSEEQE